MACVFRSIATAAVAAGVTNLDVLVDVNVGMNRCGIHWENHTDIVVSTQAILRRCL